MRKNQVNGCRKGSESSKKQMPEEEQLLKKSKDAKTSSRAENYTISAESASGSGTMDSGSKKEVMSSGLSSDKGRNHGKKSSNKSSLKS